MNVSSSFAGLRSLLNLFLFNFYFLSQLCQLLHRDGQGVREISEKIKRGWGTSLLWGHAIPRIIPPPTPSLPLPPHPYTPLCKQITAIHPNAWIRVLQPDLDPEKFKNLIQIHAKTLDLVRSGSAILVMGMERQALCKEYGVQEGR